MISIILPTYNEKENIVPLIKAIEKIVPKPHEIIVVDDNSPDGTSLSVKEYISKSKTKSTRLITRKKDHGLTKSIQAGIDAAKGDIVVWMDCDFSHPPEVIPLLLAQVQTGTDIVVASRFVSGGSSKSLPKIVIPNLFRDLQPSEIQRNSTGQSESYLAILLSTILNRTLSFIFQMNFHDFTSGFIAVKKSALDTLPLRGDYGEYFIDFIVRAHRKNYTMIEIPYISASRQAGESKTAPNIGVLFKRARQYSRAVIQLLFQ